MSTKYILSGDADELRKILQENRIRVSRGLVTFTPCEDHEECQMISDDKSPSFDDKKPKSIKKKRPE